MTCGKKKQFIRIHRWIIDRMINGSVDCRICRRDSDLILRKILNNCHFNVNGKVI